MADDNPKKKCPGGDTLQFGPKVGENSHLFVRHRADHTVETGIATLHEGGNDEAGNYDGVLKVSGKGPTYDVEPVWERPTAAQAAKEAPSGPAKVTSPAFRSGWGRIFGGNTTVGQA